MFITEQISGELSKEFFDALCKEASRTRMYGALHYRDWVLMYCAF